MATSIGRSLLLLLVAFLGSQLARTQVVRVDLPGLSPIDDEGVHVVPSTSRPTVPLVLPSVDTTGARFFRMFYSHRAGVDPDIDIMATPQSGGQLLFVDTNLNKDLRDDGPPRTFSDSADSFTLEITSPNDPEAISRFLLRRTPEVSDSDVAFFIDPDGNLQPRQARFWAEVGSASSFTGARGTFFFDSRLNLRRGSMQIGTQEHEIGLLDYDNDGLFNGPDDALLVDTPNPGTLEYFGCSYAFDDVVQLGSLRLTVSGADPYGRWVDLAITDKPSTPFQVARPERTSQESFSSTPIEEAVWGIRSISLQGDTIALSRYRGQYVLFNFWGEWCKPCLEEIPVLLKASDGHSTVPLHIVGFLRYKNLHQAKDVIRDGRMTWPQVILSDSLESFFRVRGYPTNILVRPDGRYVRRSGVLQESTLNALVR